jgi:hypothetical protein
VHPYPNQRGDIVRSEKRCCHCILALMCSVHWKLESQNWCRVREYELMTEAHAKLSVVKLLQILSPCVSGGGETAGGRGVVSSSRGWGEADSTQGDRIWSSLVRRKVERGLLLMIHILCAGYTSPAARRERLCVKFWDSGLIRTRYSKPKIQWWHFFPNLTVTRLWS